MNIRDLRYVVAVAELEHFGRAAEQCHVSQPALSGQIRKLEEELGIVLFERTRRSVRVTGAGDRIVAKARQLIELADDITATARAARDPLSGPFRLGMIPTVAPDLSPHILPAIRRELPDLTLTLVEDLTGGLEARLSAGELDAAILATAPADPHLAEMPLYREPFLVALAAGHPLAGRDAIDLPALKPERLLLLAEGHCLRDQVVDLCQTAQGLPNANTRETSLATLLALVAAGDGLTLVPALSAAFGVKACDNIVFRPETSGTATRSVRLVFRTAFPRMAAINKLAGVIQNALPVQQIEIIR